MDLLFAGLKVFDNGERKDTVPKSLLKDVDFILLSIESARLVN